MFKVINNLINGIYFKDGFLSGGAGFVFSQAAYIKLIGFFTEFN
jgi:hypothetical protein